jgi:hypothetical protein
MNEKKYYASCRWSHPDVNGRAVNFNHLKRHESSFRRPKYVTPLEMTSQTEMYDVSAASRAAR